MSLDWTTVKSLAIPVGGVSRDVKRVSIGGAVVWEKPSPLPYDAEVEYLESTGTQWIDTTTIDDPANNIAQVTFSITSSTSASMFIFGSSPARFNFVAARWGSGRYNFGPTGATTPVLPISVGDVHTGTYTLDNDQLAYTLDGASAVYGSSMVFDNLPFGLFTIYNSTVNKFIGRIYNFKVTRKSDGAVLADYIPVRVGNVGYLYDRVTGTLFGNAGTGDFVVGQDVVPVEWLGSNRDAYINTGFIPNTNTRFDVDVAFTALPTTFEACGIYRLSPTSRFNIGAKTGAWNLSYGNDNSITATIDTARHHYSIDAKNLRWVFDDTSGTFAETSATYNYPFYLFARNSSNGVAENKMSAKIFGSKIWDNGNLARNFSPVRVGSGSTWEGAMMDTLTRRIYRNAGTGAFTYGADLPYPIGG